MLNERDRQIYLFGIFDGEGCICPSFRKDGYIGLYLTVSMASKEVIEMFCAEWGGNVRSRTPTKRGYQRLYVWGVQGTSALPFLQQFRQIAVVKKRQADLAVLLATEFAKVKHTARGKNRPVITADEWATRRSIARAIQSLNGARSRYAA